MPKLDTDELDFVVEIRNSLQLTIANMSESLIDQAIDEINDQISQRCCTIAGEMSSAIMEEFPSANKSVSEDQIYEELQNKVEEAVRNELRY